MEVGGSEAEEGGRVQVCSVFRLLKGGRFLFESETFEACSKGCSKGSCSF